MPKFIHRLMFSFGYHWLMFYLSKTNRTYIFNYFGIERLGCKHGHMASLLVRIKVVNIYEEIWWLIPSNYYTLLSFHVGSEANNALAAFISNKIFRTHRSSGGQRIGIRLIQKPGFVPNPLNPLTAQLRCFPKFNKVLSESLTIYNKTVNCEFCGQYFINI